MRDQVLVASIAIVFLISFAVPATANDQLARLEGVQLILNPAKTRIVPGEALNVRFEIRNESALVVHLRAGRSVEVGRLALDVAEGNGPFRRCRGPMWGMEEHDSTKAVDLEPGQSVFSETTVLYNSVTRTNGLVPSAVASIRAQELDTTYVFERPGRYQLRATFFPEPGTASIISESADVVVGAPSGQDAQAWEQLRACGGCARFLHTGGMGGDPDAEGNKASAELLTRVLTEYPHSTYALQIREALTSYDKVVRNSTQVREEQRRAREAQWQ